MHASLPATDQLAKAGKGHKFCRQCQAVIGARKAICPHCQFVYPFKGRSRNKPHKNKPIELLINANYKHAVFSTDMKSNGEECDRDHSTFLKKTPNFIEIEPSQKQAITTEIVDGYIHESQSLLDCAFQQITEFGNVESAAKILNRTLTNLTYLATLCDSNDYHHQKCPDLSNFI